MTQYKGTLQGNRDEVSRLGTYKSGLQASVAGLNISVRLDLQHINGKDIVSVYLADRSPGFDSTERLYARLTEGELVFPGQQPQTR